MHQEWTLAAIVEQLRFCGYRCIAGSLEQNVAFQALEEMTQAATQPVPKQDIADALTLLIEAGLVDPDADDTLVTRIGAWLSTVPGVVESGRFPFSEDLP